MKYNYIFIIIVSSTNFFTYPKLQEQYNTNQEINELIAKTPQEYTPNPIILEGVDQIMNGALSIAQNPHNRPNIGFSIVSMVHGIIKIIIQKIIAHKKNNRLPSTTISNEDCEILYKEVIEEILDTINQSYAC